MNIYLASRFNRRSELRGYREQLTGMGHVVTSRWLDWTGPGSDSTGQGPQDMLEDKGRHLAEEGALADIADILGCDLFVVFTHEEGGGWGGHHTEYGIALGTGKNVAVVGPRVSVFHCLSYVPVYPNFGEFLRRAYLPVQVGLGGNYLGAPIPGITERSH